MVTAWRTVHVISTTEQAIQIFYLSLYDTSCIGSSAVKMKDNSLVDELQTAVNIVLSRLRDELGPLNTKTLMKSAKVLQ